MSMNINGTSASSPSQTAAWQQRKQDYSTMMAGAQSGDIGTAQTAYASLTANRAPPADSPLAALGTALQSGDATAVQKAAQALQQARTGHTHHHRHNADATSTDATSTSTPSASDTTGVNILV